MDPKTSSSRLLAGDHLDAVGRIAMQFAIDGAFRGGEEIETGHINSTYRVSFETEDGGTRRYILQRINQSVFKDPLTVMANIERVTRHINRKVLRVKKDLGGQTLNLYPGRDGKSSVEGPEGGIWRCYNFIEGCETYDIVENTRQAYQAAKAFGAFQDLVSDLPADSLVETIPDFHNTRMRYEHLMKIADLDPQGRTTEVSTELRFIRQHQSETERVLALLDSGRIPMRITHNDTKINNVMFDAATDEAACVIDLDTVMPGSILYDFGDLVRTAVSPAAEDEADLTKMELRLPFFEALVEGYLESARGFLVQEEVEQLVFSAKLITLELGIRFLTDYLEGDVYFRSLRPGQNLDRARNQLKLVELIEDKSEEMEAFVAKVWKGS